MNRIQSFFLHCSAAHPSILKRTPTETSRFVGIGATIFFTGVFAALASAYAIHTVFNNYVVSVIFGLLWGLMIFNLDRYIVSTIRKKGKFFRDTASIVPRLALAVLIAVVIAKPLELKVFETEINAEIELMQQEDKLVKEKIVNERYASETRALNNDISMLKNEIAEKTNKRDELHAAALAEADGTGGTMKRNMGPIYKIKKAEADKADTELQQLISSHQPLIETKLEDLEMLAEQRRGELAALTDVSRAGLASRIEALSRLGNKSDAIWYAGIFIMLLFIAIETAPIIVKLIAERSPYDYVLNKHENTFEMLHHRQVALLEHETKSIIDYNREVSLNATEMRIQAEKELTETLIRERLEELKKSPGTLAGWLQNKRFFGA